MHRTYVVKWSTMFPSAAVLHRVIVCLIARITYKGCLCTAGPFTGFTCSSVFACHHLSVCGLSESSTTALVDLGRADGSFDKTSEISWVLPGRRFLMWSFKTICTRSHSFLQISR